MSEVLEKILTAGGHPSRGVGQTEAIWFITGATRLYNNVLCV